MSTNPIKFPNLDAVNARWAARQATERAAAEHPAAARSPRFTEAVDAAWRNGQARGHEDGYRNGFKTGTHWGMLCGALAMLGLGALGVIVTTMVIGVLHGY